MVDSVELFKAMYKNEFLRKSAFILFFNKKDLFEEKIKHNSISNYFPNFKCSNNYEEIFLFITNLFLNVRILNINFIYNYPIVKIIELFLSPHLDKEKR